MNLIVVAVLINVGSMELTTVFKFIAFGLALATVLQYQLFRASLHHSQAESKLLASDQELEESLLRNSKKVE